MAGFEEQLGFPLEITLWDIVDAETGELRYEYWVQGAGDGTVFDAGTDESPDAIGSAQHHFWAAGGDDAATLAVVVALQAAASTAGL